MLGHESVTIQHSPSSFTFPTMKAPCILFCSHTDLGLFHLKDTEKLFCFFLYQSSEGPAVCANAAQPAVTAQIPAQGAPCAQVPHRGGNRREKQEYFSTDSNPTSTLPLSNIQLISSSPSPCQISHRHISKPLIKSSVLYPRDSLSPGLPFEEKKGTAP